MIHIGMKCPLRRQSFDADMMTKCKPFWNSILVNSAYFTAINSFVTLSCSESQRIIIVTFGN